VLLDTVAHQVVETREVEDRDMMFGLCELTMYALGAGLASPGAGLVDEWVGELHDECKRFLEV
jgi:hypothetical protein